MINEVIDLNTALFLGGVLLGWVGSWFFSKDTNKKLLELTKLTSEIFDEMRFQKENTDKLMSLIPENNLEEACIIAHDLNKSVTNITKEVKAVNIAQNLNLDISSLEHNCSQCGKKMTDEGYKNTPFGLVWHYRCPEHGIISGNSFNDIWDE